MIDEFYALVLIGGPVLLLAAIIWATLRVRSASRRNEQVAEAGAEELREEIKRDPDYQAD